MFNPLNCGAALSFISRKAVSRTASAVIIAVIVTAIVSIAGTYAVVHRGAATVTVTSVKTYTVTSVITSTVTSVATVTSTSKPSTTSSPVTHAKISVVKIGLIEPLTGRYAVFGIQAKEAAQLVINVINNELGGIKSLGGAKIQLVVADAGETPDEARMAAERLITQQHPAIIIGAYISKLTAAVAEVTNKYKVILFMDGLVDSLTQHGWKYVFRVAPKASAHGKSAVDFVVSMAKKKGLKIKTAVVLHEDSIFGTYTAEGAVLELRKYGIEVLDVISYPCTISDVSSIVNKVKADHPDIIITIPYFHDGVLLAKAFKAEGIHPMFIAGAGGCGYTDPDSIKAAGKAVLYYTNTYSFNPYRPTKWCKKLVSAFEAKYHKLPTEAAGIIFYTLMTIYEGLEKAGQMYPSDPLNPDHLRSVFLSLDLTDSNSIAAQLYPTGHIKFAPNGDNMYAGTAILQVQLINGKETPVLVWPEPQPGVHPVFPRPDWSGASASG